MTRYTCCLCKRTTVPAVFIGLMPVGPKCARKAGLLGKAAPRGVRASKNNKSSGAPRCAKTLDLFAATEDKES